VSAELRAAAEAIYEAYGPADDYAGPYRQAWERLRDALAEPLAAASVATGPLPEPVQALALSGRKLDAIRLLRIEYGIGLLLAKDAVEAFIATENLRREARTLATVSSPAPAPPPTCGTCRWLRNEHREPVCGHESEAHPLHWCQPVGNPETFGCTFHAAKEPTR
jgi:hypothetical protein